LRAYDRDDQNLGQDALIALALGIDPAPRPFVTCGPDVFETRRESFSLLMIEKNVSGQGVVVAVADPSPRPWAGQPRPNSRSPCCDTRSPSCEGR